MPLEQVNNHDAVISNKLPLSPLDWHDVTSDSGRSESLILETPVTVCLSQFAEQERNVLACYTW